MCRDFFQKPQSRENQPKYLSKDASTPSPSRLAPAYKSSLRGVSTDTDTDTGSGTWKRESLCDSLEERRGDGLLPAVVVVKVPRGDPIQRWAQELGRHDLGQDRPCDRLACGAAAHHRTRAGM